MWHVLINGFVSWKSTPYLAAWAQQSPKCALNDILRGFSESASKIAFPQHCGSYQYLRREHSLDLESVRRRIVNFIAQ